MRVLVLAVVLSACGGVTQSDAGAGPFDSAHDCASALACICAWNDARGSFCSGDRDALQASCANRVAGWYGDEDAGGRAQLDADFARCGRLEACAYMECMARGGEPHR